MTLVLTMALDDSVGRINSELIEFSQCAFLPLPLALACI